MLTTIVVRRARRFQRSIGGDLSINGKYVCHTLELPWRWNEHDVSCIPAGTYPCWWRYDRGRLQLENIRCSGGKRLGVQIHRGAIPDHSKGCILIGTVLTPDHLSGATAAQAALEQALFPGQFGPGYGGGPMNVRIEGVLINSRFDNLDKQPPPGLFAA